MEVEVGLNISRAFLEKMEVGFGLGGSRSFLEKMEVDLGLVNPTLGSPEEDGGGPWLGQPNVGLS